MPVLLPEKKAIFIHLPKNAGTSVTIWLHRHSNTKIQKAKRKHDGFKESLEKYGPFNFSFAIVRNPYDRIVSSYFYNKRLCENRTPITMDQIEKLTGRKKGKLLRTYNLQENINQGFETFVKSKCWHPVQRLQCEMANGVQYILKYENLVQDFKLVQDYFKCNKPLRSSNISKHDEYKKYYTEELYNIVTEEIKDDLEAYNYTF